jgi:predicted cupin superfamily sugar epimerase
MHPRARELIERLRLEAHPEGGLFRRTFESSRNVRLEDGRDRRRALTAIYYLLVDRCISRWHRVLSDETWHWYEGAAVELFVAPPDGGAVATHRLGALGENTAPQFVVPASCWQAARCLGGYALVGCCVAPGFDFADFTLLSSLAEHGRPRLAPQALMDAFM